MPTFEVDRTPINLFALDEQYVFKHYFEQADVFAALRPHYNEDGYRFEVPAERFDEVQALLRDHFFEPVVIRDLEPFCVVKRKHTEHPSVLFKASVLQRSTSNYHVFLMKDRLSVEQAVNNGAIPLSKTDIEPPG